MEGAASLGDAADILPLLKLEADGLPMNPASFSRNIRKVNPLFARIFDKPSLNVFTVDKWTEKAGESYKFSEDAQRAWDWTDAFLRRQDDISPDWFGFSPLTTSVKRPRG